jgi:hypothetical protein
MELVVKAFLRGDFVALRASWTYIRKWGGEKERRNAGVLLPCLEPT